MFLSDFGSSGPAQILEEHFNAITDFLSPKDIHNLSQVNSSLYNLHASQQAWKALMKTIFAPQSSSTGRSTDFEEEKSNYTRESQEISSGRSKTEQKTSKTTQLRREILNSLIFPEDPIILQPLQSPIDFLLEKTSYTEKDLNEIKGMLQARAEKLTITSKKLEGLFVLSNQHNQSLISEINSLVEIKNDFEDKLQKNETDSMKKLLDVIRNTISKQNTGVREAYKEFTQKKRAATHLKSELDDATNLIHQIRMSFQACLLVGVEKYSKNIEDILKATGELQEKAQAIAENFNYFLFNKLYDLLTTRLPENKIDLENVLLSCEDLQYQEKVKEIWGVAKNISSKWEELSKQRETQKGKFSTRDNLLFKKLNFVQEVLKDLVKFGERLRKAKEDGSSFGTLRILGATDKEKRIMKLLTLVNPINVKFNIYEWGNVLSWNELREKVIKELKELKIEEKEKEKPDRKDQIEAISNQKRTPVKLRIKKGSAVLPSLENKDMMSKTMGVGFFKPPSPRKVEIARPKSSYKENRKEITEEEEEYLKTTFHPGVKWKIL